MALITEEIYSQSFELIRDRIAEILIEELENQVTRFHLSEIYAEFFIERVVPIDKSEMSVINLSFAGGNLQSENIKDGTTPYTYNVDVYTNSKTNIEKHADNRAAVRCQKILGVCRSILKNPVYKTLAFIPGTIISGVSVSQISIADAKMQDANSAYMGRLSVIVKAIETTSYIIPNNIEGYSAKLKIEDGNTGYKYSSD